MANDAAKLEFIRLSPPAWLEAYPRLSAFFLGPVAWASVTLVCSFFYIDAMLVLACLTGLLVDASRGYALAVFACLALLCTFPNRPWRAVQTLFWLWTDIFKIKANVPNLDPAQRYLFVIAPHGVFPFWSWVYSTFLSQSPYGKPVGGGVASVLLSVPLMRQLTKWTACVPASYKPLKSALMRESQQICPEGIAGIFATPKNFRNANVQTLELRERKGFVRLAIQCGAPIVPVYCFGNSDTFTLAGGAGSTLAALSRTLKMSITCFYGQCGLPIPFAVNLTMVSGRPVAVRQTDEPTQAEIDAVHAEYLASLTQAFEGGKEAAGYGAQKLVIV